MVGTMMSFLPLTTSTALRDPLQAARCVRIAIGAQATIALT